MNEYNVNETNSSDDDTSAPTRGIEELERELISQRRSSVCGTLVLKSNVSFWTFLCLTVLLLVLGGGIFSLIEYPAEQREIEEAIITYNERKAKVMDILLNYTSQNSTAADELYLQLKEYSNGIKDRPDDIDEHWKLRNSAIFSFTVVTTIGYGTFAPQTSSGQMFLIIYALVGIPVAGLTLSFFANRALYIFTWLSQVGSDKAEEAFLTFDQDNSGCLEKEEFEDAVKMLNIKMTREMFDKVWNLTDKDGGGTINLIEFRHAITIMNADVTEASGRRTRVVVTLCGIVFWIIVGMFVFMITEKWEMYKSFYFVIVSLTTIGLGDFFPISNAGLYFLICFAMVGLGLIAILFSLVEGFFRELKTSAKDSKK